MVNQNAKIWYVLSTISGEIRNSGPETASIKRTENRRIWNGLMGHFCKTHAPEKYNIIKKKDGYKDLSDSDMDMVRKSLDNRGFLNKPLPDPEKGIDFSKINFGKVNFIGYIFPFHVAFDYSTFLNSVSFAESCFLSSVSFANVKFNRRAFFTKSIFARSATFESSTCSSVANFNDCRFNGDTTFKSLNGSGRVSFRKAEFKKNASFTRAVFIKLVDFTKTHFHSDVFYTSTTFESVVTLQIPFELTPFSFLE